ncbi:hypothetical protein TNCV_4459901 [Trichonephila clavipes]|nr:hypothetical protein TNCV_4459901 [Trichonephila clavipes]
MSETQRQSAKYSSERNRKDIRRKRERKIVREVMCFRWKWREQVIKQRDFAGHEKDSDDASALYRFFLLPLPQYIDLFGKGREKKISFSFFSFIIGCVVDDVLLLLEASESVSAKRLLGAAVVNVSKEWITKQKTWSQRQAWGRHRLLNALLERRVAEVVLSDCTSVKVQPFIKLLEILIKGHLKELFAITLHHIGQGWVDFLRAMVANDLFESLYCRPFELEQTSPFHKGAQGLNSR